MSTFLQSPINITFVFSRNLYKVLLFKQIVNFLFALKSTSDFIRFKYLQIMRTLYFIFVVLSIALARPDTSLPVVREITPIKTYNFRIESGKSK